MAEQAIRQRTPEDLAMIQRIKDQTGHDVTRISLVRARMAAGVSKDSEGIPFRDVLLFMMIERELGLDSLLGQIHWIYRQGKGSHQVGIDGFRAIADRSGCYAGSEPPIYRGTVEQKYGQGSFTAPEEASVLVRKLVQGHVCSFVGVATWVEYYPADDRQNFMWRKMPKHMLGKVAEANALRKAFPSQLAGLPLADDEPATEPSVRVVEQASPMYDQIFNEQDDLPMSEDPQAPIDPAPEEGEPGTPPVPAPSDPWQDNRQLYFQAVGLGLRPKTLRNNMPLEQVAAYNDELRGMIDARRMAPA